MSLASRKYDITSVQTTAGIEVMSDMSTRLFFIQKSGGFGFFFFSELCMEEELVRQFNEAVEQDDIGFAVVIASRLAAIIPQYAEMQERLLKRLLRAENQSQLSSLDLSVVSKADLWNFVSDGSLPLLFRDASAANVVRCLCLLFPSESVEKFSSTSLAGSSQILRDALCTRKDVFLRGVLMEAYGASCMRSSSPMYNFVSLIGRGRGWEQEKEEEEEEKDFILLANEDSFHFQKVCRGLCVTARTLLHHMLREDGEKFVSCFHGGSDAVAEWSAERTFFFTHSVDVATDLALGLRRAMVMMVRESCGVWECVWHMQQRRPLCVWQEKKKKEEEDGEEEEEGGGVVGKVVEKEDCDGDEDNNDAVLVRRGSMQQRLLVVRARLHLTSPRSMAHWNVDIEDEDEEEDEDFLGLKKNPTTTTIQEDVAVVVSSGLSCGACGKKQLCRKDFSRNQLRKGTAARLCRACTKIRSCGMCAHFVGVGCTKKSSCPLRHWLQPEATTGDWTGGGVFE